MASTFKICKWLTGVQGPDGEHHDIAVARTALKGVQNQVAVQKVLNYVSLRVGGGITCEHELKQYRQWVIERITAVKNPD